MNKYTTVSVPKPLADDIKLLTDELGYWPSLSSFVREALLEKLNKERERKRKVDPKGRD